MRVLIITNNIENEMTLHEQLNRLNHEIYITRDLYVNWLQSGKFPHWISNFPMIFISETISQKEALEILEYINNWRTICLLKIDDVLTIEEEEVLYDKGFDACISTQGSFSELRETIFNCSTKEKKETDIQKKQLILPFKNFQEQLAPKDQQIISALLKATDRPISRKELSNVLWHKCTNATLSQLSLRIGKINQKISNEYGIDCAIQTLWRKGYYFNDLFYSTIVKNEYL
ncbi:winged helix-turn-helix domain-containing protein [Enterococcus alishanensis]